MTNIPDVEVRQLRPCEECVHYYMAKCNLKCHAFEKREETFACDVPEYESGNIEIERIVYEAYPCVNHLTRDEWKEFNKILQETLRCQ